MPLRFVALVLIASVCAAQTPTTPQLGSSGPVDGIVLIPGTLIAAKLVTAIKSKSTKRGDPVRAVVAFPVVAGTRVAVPAGTYIEGVVEKVNARPSGMDTSTVQLRFTRLLFATGYSVPLVANNTQSLLMPESASPPTCLLADARDGASFLGEGFAAGQMYPQPQPPPLPSVGPSPAKVAGIAIGIFAGIMVSLFAINHHRIANTDYVVFDSGWQFQIALQQPLTLDPALVAAATSLPQ